MLKSIHSPLRRIAISAMVALATITGFSHSVNAQLFRSRAECEAQMQALIRAGKGRCVPVHTEAPVKAQVVKAWLKQFKRKLTPNNTPADAYEIKHTGSDNILLKGGGKQVWADGVRAKDATVLEAKYVGKPRRSPYVPSSECPPFLAQGITTKTADEFMRYAAVINDPKTPVDKLQVITNNQAAAPYFNCLMRKYNIPGSVVVKP